MYTCIDFDVLLVYANKSAGKNKENEYIEKV